MRKVRACLEDDSPSGYVRHYPPVKSECLTLCAGTCRDCEPPFSEVQDRHNEALVIQGTMQHVRSIAQQHPHSIHKTRGRQVARVKLLILITRLWHDAEGAGLNIVSVPRPCTSEALKILAALDVPLHLTRSNHTDAPHTRDVLPVQL